MKIYKKVNISLSRRTNNERLKTRIKVIKLWRELSSRFRKRDYEIPLVKKSDVVQEEVKPLSFNVNVEDSNIINLYNRNCILDDVKRENIK